jgi:hypothetical protein
MVAAVAGALSGRVFRLSGGIMPPARSSRWRIVDRRALKETGRIVGVRPCGRGEDKGDKASADKHGHLRGGKSPKEGKSSVICGALVVNRSFYAPGRRELKDRSEPGLFSWRRLGHYSPMRRCHKRCTALGSFLSARA